MIPQRPNPFTSFEGCLLSQTLWGLLVMVGLFGGAMVGKELGDDLQSTSLGAITGVYLLGFTPWRRWLAAWLRRRQQPTDNAGPGEPPSP